MKAKAVDRSELMNCRDACHRWLWDETRALGLYRQINVHPECMADYPECMTSVILERRNVPPRLAAVAAVLEWICDVALAQFHDDAEPLQTQVIVTSDFRNATVVEVPEPSAQEVAARKRIQKEIAQAGRKGRALTASLEDLMGAAKKIDADLEFVREEENKRMRAARTVGEEWEVVLTAADGATRAVDDETCQQFSDGLDSVHDTWARRGMTLIQSLDNARVALRDLEASLVAVNRGRPYRTREGALAIAAPRVHSEWTRCRGELDRYLREAGFMPREIDALLPGGSAARTSMRLYRQRKRAAG